MYLQKLLKISHTYIRILILDLLCKLQIFSQFVVKLLILLITIFAMQGFLFILCGRIDQLFMASGHRVIVRKAFFYSEVQ